MQVHYAIKVASVNCAQRNFGSVVAGCACHAGRGKVVARYEQRLVVLGGGLVCLRIREKGVEILIAMCNSQFPRFMAALCRDIFSSAVSGSSTSSETYDNS